jgi:peptidyl-prolyl cis-trans isomerase SurA
MALYFKNTYPTHQVDLEWDFARIKIMALEEKRERVLKEWFYKTIKEVPVWVDPELSDCKLFLNGK